MQYVWQTFHDFQQPECSSTQPHRRKTVQMYHLWEVLWTIRHTEQPQGDRSTTNVYLIVLSWWRCMSCKVQHLKNAFRWNYASMLLLLAHFVNKLCFKMNLFYFHRFILLSVPKKFLHWVSRNVPNITDCNLKKDCQILTIFGMDTLDTTRHQMTIQFSTLPNICVIALSGENRTHSAMAKRVSSFDLSSSEWQCCMAWAKRLTAICHLCYTLSIK